MTTDSTAQYSSGEPPISSQRALVHALADLIDRHPTLPAAYIIVRSPFQDWSGQVNLQLDNWLDFEAWRTALDIPPADVTLHCTVSSTWLAVDTTHQGVTFHLSGSGIRLSIEEMRAPRERPDVAQTAKDVASWNERHPVGTPVTAYPGARDGTGLKTRTRSEAWALGGHTAVVMVDGYGGGIALDHVDARTEATSGVTA